MAATATRTLQEMRDIVNNDMPQIYDRTAGVDDVREVLELEAAMEVECERREMDARAMIRDTIDLLEQRHRAIVEPSEQAFVARVREVEQERAQAASHIQEQAEEAAARERDIERMQGEVEDTQTEIENTVDAHTMEMPRVQNAIGLYTNITRIKWNYETEGEIMAGWLIPPEAGVGMKGANGTAVVEGFQFDAAGKDDFEVANKLWDVIDGKARAMVEA
ncbi:unnamed protein product [Ectocarpus sp. 13 AM-2016]